MMQNAGDDKIGLTALPRRKCRNNKSMCVNKYNIGGGKCRN